MARKITDKSKMRDNLKYERDYEKKNRVERNASKKIKTPIRQEWRKLLEEKIWRKLRKWETVWHKKPIAKWGNNSKANLKVQSAKSNYAEWAKMTHKIRRNK